MQNDELEPNGPDAPYAHLLAMAREVQLLQSSAALLSWDQETFMPPEGAAHRAKQLALLARLAHERVAGAEFAGLLDEAAAAPTDPAAAVNLRELRRLHERAVRVPPGLVAELAETTSLAQGEWAAARAASDFARFAPWLEKLLQLSRRRAECLGWPAGGEAWDALAEDFEPGMTAQQIAPLFASLRGPLGELVRELRERGQEPDTALLAPAVPVAAQERLARLVAEQLGFDFARGRMDLSTHPFTTSTCSRDVRFTSRFRADHVLDGLGSTMHEVGHGLYEQGLPPTHEGTPLGETVSLGIHESQSRLWENHVGRSREFWEWCTPHLQRVLGNPTPPLTAEAVWRAANVVRPDFIRVEADEATYNLHIAVRFELELALLRGDLEVAGLPAAWNAGYREHLGLEVPDDRRGCLQDVHWSCGMFGYFPTYTLGNLYGAQIFEAATRALPGLPDAIAGGRFALLRDWLGEQVHAQGSRFTAAELCERVCGGPLGADAYLRYLGTKLRAVYRL
ncbi:MAG: carboxypeptidase M32 [Planctomycetota bacterium]